MNNKNVFFLPFNQLTMTTSAIIIIFHHLINQIFLSANYRSMTTNDVFYPDFLLAKFPRSFNLTLN